MHPAMAAALSGESRSLKANSSRLPAQRLRVFHGAHLLALDHPLRSARGARSVKLRHPRELGAGDVRRFLTYNAAERAMRRTKR